MANIPVEGWMPAVAWLAAAAVACDELDASATAKPLMYRRLWPLGRHISRGSEVVMPGSLGRGGAVVSIMVALVLEGSSINEQT